MATQIKFLYGLGAQSRVVTRRSGLSIRNTNAAKIGGVFSVLDDA